MKTVIDHIEYVKGKPHHIRRKVALSAAVLGSALIAVIWFGTSVVTGAFAIEGSSFALSTGQQGTIATTSSSDMRGLAGAAAALDDDDGPARIEIVDTGTATEPQKKTEPTILPF